MSYIVIEGTVTPSTFLPTGEQRRVTRTAFVDKLIVKGYVRVVSSDPAVAPLAEASATAEAAEPIDVPGRNESRAVWAQFLESRGIAFETGDTRDDLIDRFYLGEDPADG